MALFLEVLDYHSNCEKGWEKKSGSQYTSRLFLELNLPSSTPQRMLHRPLLLIESCYHHMVADGLSNDRDVSGCCQSSSSSSCLFWVPAGYARVDRGGKDQIGSMDNCDISFTVPNETLTICVESDVLITALMSCSTADVTGGRDSNGTALLFIKE